jgi:predicted amidophosphoribosyltransferase
MKLTRTSVEEFSDGGSGKMICSKCGKDIGGYLACKNCAKTASAMQDKLIMERYERDAYRRILSGARPIWVQDCTCNGEPKVQHLAFALWIFGRTFSFCGHELSTGKCKGPQGSETYWKPEYESDKELCPLCVDRLMSLGGGICRDICSICGGHGKHRSGCEYRKLNDSNLVAKLTATGPK